jgi:hypothetical protein
MSAVVEQMQPSDHFRLLLMQPWEIQNKSNKCLINSVALITNSNQIKSTLVNHGLIVGRIDYGYQ